MRRDVEHRRYEERKSYTMAAIKAKEGIYYVGALDKDLRVFDIVMYSDYGTTYNAYLVKGGSKNVLFETVKDKFFDVYLANIREVIDLEDIDYIVANHTEPDHAGSYEKILEYAPNATVLGTATAITFLKEIINKPFPHKVVTEKDVIDLGGMQMKFLSVPMLHWPDSMYTYIPELKALFTCDSFGCHYADDRIFNDLIPGDFTDAYKYYFDNIIGPFRNPHMLNALKKIENLDVDFIGNGHGPVLRTNLQKYIDMYREWSTPAPKKAEKTVAIAYVSAYGYTATLARTIAEALKEGGVAEVNMFDLVTDDKAAAAAAIAQADAFLLGSPTILGDALPPIWEMLLGVNPIIHKGKPAGAFGSYGWSGEAVGNLTARMEQLKLSLPVPGLKVRFKPSEAQLEEARQFGLNFAKAIL